MPKVRRKYSRWCETLAAKKVSCLFRRCCHRVNHASPDASCDLARPANCRLVLVSGGVSVNFCSVSSVFPPLGLWRRSPTAAASRCKSPLARFFTGPKEKKKKTTLALFTQKEKISPCRDVSMPYLCFQQFVAWWFRCSKPLSQPQELFTWQNRKKLLDTKGRNGLT